jgi:hypothetical protein
MTRSGIHALLMAVASTLLAACSDSPSPPAATSSPQPPPGTVTVHLNGTVAAGFSVR